MNSYSQTYTFWNADMQAIAKPESREGWIAFNETLISSPLNIFTTHTTAFGLENEDQMLLKSTETDNLGWTHYKYQQYHNNIEVLGAVAIIYSKGIESKMSGKVIPSEEFIQNVVVNDSLAFSNCLAHINASTYSWQDSTYEHFYQIKHGINATSMPSGELKYLFEGSNLFLTYEFKIATLNPYSLVKYYINTTDGQIVYEDNQILNCVTGTACTQYNGTKPIETIQEGTQFKLFSDCHGDGIDTRYDPNTLAIFADESHYFPEVFDDDNFWDDNCPATSTHIAGIEYYNYLSTVHGRDSYDGIGGLMKQNVATSTICTFILPIFVFNAAYSKESEATYFTDANDPADGWLTTYDVIGHE